MNKMMNKLYSKSDKPMAVINVDYIEHLKKVVADQEASNKQTSEFLAAIGNINYQSIMVKKHEQLAKRVITNSKMDDWSPNV